LQQAATTDNKEGFDLGSPHWSELAKHSKVFGAATPWPEEEALPGYRAYMEQYQESQIQLAYRLLAYIAESLSLPQDYFKQRFKTPVTTLRTLHYYAHTSYQEGEIGAGAHTDYGGLTILLQGTGGLQVLSSARNEWIHVPPTPGVYTINIGDMMMRWTNARYTSTIHRVINISNIDRYSVPFFFNPSLDTTIECLPQCKADRTPEEPVLCKEVLEDFYIRAGLLNEASDAKL